MFPNFRLAMAWVHTWFGLVLGFVLMATFFFGALTVFAREIDRWAIPESRFPPQPVPSVDNVLLPIFRSMQPGQEAVEDLRVRLNGAPVPSRFDTVDYWQLFTTHRDSLLSLYAGYLVPDATNANELVYAQRTLDPRTGRAISDDRLAIGMGFFYPLHFNLTLEWRNLGAWIVGLASLAMLAVLVSGVVIHRKLFREFFSFRPQKELQRSTLDLHNLSGVVALPFHFFFAFTGLVIFAGIYFPIAQTQLAPLHELHERREAAESGLPSRRAGVPAPLASVDAMVAEAQRRWAARGKAGEVGDLILLHVGDANGYVAIYPAAADSFAFATDGIKFRASTGEVLREDPPATTMGQVTEFVTGLHLMPYRHWLLRWLYFLGGIVGCVCIATGFLYFVEKRKRQHAKEGCHTARVVDALAATVVTGMPIATLGILIANWLLPDSLPTGWPARPAMEYCAFWLAWLLAMAHAFWRTAPTAQGRFAPVWREQASAIAVMAVTAVCLNGIVTGDHLVKTIGEGYWPVAGVDLVLLASALVAGGTAGHLGRRAVTDVDRSSGAVAPSYEEAHG